MTQRKAEALIALGLTLRGTSLLFSKLAMQTIGPFTLCGIRFLISFAVVALIFHKQIRSVTKKEVLHSAIVGFLYFCCMAFELLGLRTTPSSTTAFIENTSVVIVPLLAAIVYRRLPKRMDILCALIALAGIAFMTLKGSKLAFTPGELLIFCDAVSYAITVVVMDIVTVDDNALNIGVFHLFFIDFILIKHLPCNSGKNPLKPEKKMFCPNIWMLQFGCNLPCHIQRFLRLPCILLFCHIILVSFFQSISVHNLHRSRLPVHELLLS